MARMKATSCPQGCLSEGSQITNTASPTGIKEPRSESLQKAFLRDAALCHN